LHSFLGGEAIGTCSAGDAKLQAHAAPIKAKLGYFQRVIISLKISCLFSEKIFIFFIFFLKVFQSIFYALMAPKQRPGKEATTSAIAPSSPPPAVGHPIAGREIFPFSEIFISL